MQTISATAAAILAEGSKLGVTIACSGVNGNRTLTASDIVRRSFYLDRNSSSGTNLEIGNAEAAELGFLLENADGRFNRYIFEGAILTVDLVIGAETLRLGVFRVDNSPKRSKTMQIVALDNMAQFNRAYGTALTGTPTLGQLAADCCTACGVTLNTTTFTNSTVAANIPTDEDITFHQVICWIAELAGTCAWIDSAGELNFSWYGENQGATVITMTSDNLIDPVISENDIVITGVIIRDSDSETLVGADGYVLTIDSNPLVIAANVSTLLTAIGTKIVGNRYRPFECDALALPHVWPMDALTIDLDDPIATPADGMDIVAQASSADMSAVVNGAGVSGADMFVAAVPKPIAWVTNHRYTLNSLSRLAGRGETVTEAGYAGATPFTSVQRTDMVKMTKQVVEVMGLVADWIISGKLLSADGKTYFDLDNSEIKQTATINGKAVVVTINPTKGIEITVDGDQAGGLKLLNGIVTTISEALKGPNDDRAYIRVGDDPAMTNADFMYGWYSATGSAPYTKRFKISEYYGGAELAGINDDNGSCYLTLNTYPTHGGGAIASPVMQLYGKSAASGYGSSVYIYCPGSASFNETIFQMKDGFFSFIDSIDAVGIPVFANNAAAITGGLSVGALYRTGGNPDPVCIVH